MYANAYQNAPCFEVWDSKGKPPPTQSIRPKTSSINNFSKYPPTQTPALLISRPKATWPPFRVKMAKWRFLQTIVRPWHCTNDFWCCMLLYQSDSSGGWSWFSAIWVESREGYTWLPSKASNRLSIFRTGIPFKSPRELGFSLESTFSRLWECSRTKLLELWSRFQWVVTAGCAESSRWRNSWNFRSPIATGWVSKSANPFSWYSSENSPNWSYHRKCWPSPCLRPNARKSRSRCRTAGGKISIGATYRRYLPRKGRRRSSIRRWLRARLSYRMRGLGCRVFRGRRNLFSARIGKTNADLSFRITARASNPKKSQRPRNFKASNSSFKN